MTPLRIVPSAVPLDRQQAAVAIFRPFFAAGIACVLTVGCLLGALALFGIAQRGSYTASAWTPYVLAHANSQLFGWVGLFVMGFALQQHGPSVARAASFHRLAYASLGLMAAGVLLRFAAEPLVRADRDVWMPVGIAACAFQAIAVALFLTNTQINRHKSGEGLTWQSAFVFSSLSWLALVAAAEPFAFYLSHQADPQSSILFVAGWFPVMREAQFLGFAAMMIFGVSLAKFGSCFGWKPAYRSWGLAGLGLWCTALVCRIVGWRVAFVSEFAPGSANLYTFGGALFLIGGVALLKSSRILERPQSPQRSHKFVRAAYGWMIAAGLMMALEPLHLAAIGAPFSHAFTGAVRHAVTVGFISQMILGVGIHVVSRLTGTDESKRTALWATFALLNLGNAARVGLEWMTDYQPGAFIPMGWTGFVELVAIGLWALEMGRMMMAKRALPAHASC